MNQGIRGQEDWGDFILCPPDFEIPEYKDIPHFGLQNYSGLTLLGILFRFPIIISLLCLPGHHIYL